VPLAETLRGSATWGFHVGRPLRAHLIDRSRPYNVTEALQGN
jgi:hypothetical protein